jgi:hypothetical protein
VLVTTTHYVILWLDDIAYRYGTLWLKETVCRYSMCMIKYCGAGSLIFVCLIKYNNEMHTVAREALYLCV